MKEKAYAIPNAPGPLAPVIIDPELCIACNKCVDICLMDVFIPNSKKGHPPIILFPEECYYDGCCVMECPEDGAIRLNHPLMQRVRWKRKATGEHFRV
jgi:NAD-dependent dihydropyrimidine dehydrogenase PreA subunit